MLAEGIVNVASKVTESEQFYEYVNNYLNSHSDWLLKVFQIPFTSSVLLVRLSESQ